MDNDFFNFENKEMDIPFYNNNPQLSKSSWILLLFALLVGFGTYLITATPMLSGFLFCIILLVPVLYFLNWNYKAIFQKPSLNDLKWAVMMAAAYIAYATIMTYALVLTGLPVAAVNLGADLADFIFTLMGEELFKFILLAFFLCVLYKFSHNRKASIIISSAFTLAIFGLVHSISINSILRALLVQGLGSAVHLFLYIKTKNLGVSYGSHLLTDVSMTLLDFFSIL